MDITLVPQFNIEYTIQLANALSKRIGVTMLLWKNLASNYLQYLEPSVKIEYLTKPPPKDINNIKLTLHTVKKIEYTDPDIFHMQNPYSWMCIGLPFLIEFPLVLTIHDPVPHFGREQLHSRFVSKFTIGFAKRIIVHGRHMKELIVNRYSFPKDRIHVIPHGEFSFFKKYDVVFKKEKNMILFFGRIFDYKGLEYLIKAEPLISKKIPNYKIVIAGLGEFEKYIRFIKNTKNFIIINEFISNEKVNELFQKASVIVLPYIEASQTGIIPIAYSYKKPVIATNVGSLPEVVEEGETGFIVPPRNSIKLAEAIIQILKNEDLSMKMGEKAYRWMKDNLTWDKIADKTIEVYKKIR